MQRGHASGQAWAPRLICHNLSENTTREAMSAPTTKSGLPIHESAAAREMVEIIYELLRGVKMTTNLGTLGSMFRRRTGKTLKEGLAAAGYGASTPVLLAAHPELFTLSGKGTACGGDHTVKAVPRKEDVAAAAAAAEAATAEAAAAAATTGRAPKLGGFDFFRSIGSPKYVVAPMVDQSFLAYRLLCRRYGAQVRRGTRGGPPCRAARCLLGCLLVASLQIALSPTLTCGLLLACCHTFRAHCAAVLHAHVPCAPFLRVTTLPRGSFQAVCGRPASRGAVLRERRADTAARRTAGARSLRRG